MSHTHERPDPGKATGGARRLESVRAYALSICLILAIGPYQAQAAGSGGHDRTESTGPGSPATKSDQHRGTSPFSPQDRIEVFDQVWKRINDKYYDSNFNGVNWQAVHDIYRPRVDAVKSNQELYSLINRMVGELHDAHTRFHTPLERREREKEQEVTPGVFLSEVEGKTVVVSVDQDSDAARAGIEPGMIATSIDGAPVSRRLADTQAALGGTSTDRAFRLRLYHKMIDGEPGTKLELGLLRGDGIPLKISIMRQLVSDAPRIVSRTLPSGFAYIKLTLWKSPIHDEFKKTLEKFKSAPGLILDLRGNPGGEVGEVLKIAGYFVRARTPFGRFITRSGKNLDLFAGHSGTPLFSAPIAVLINESSGSGSEMFSGVMQESGRASVVGRQSCGCLLGISRYKRIKGGGELAVSELGYLSPKGRRLEGTGVIPDDPVPLTLADLQRRRDAAVEAGEAALKSRVRAAESY